MSRSLRKPAYVAHSLWRKVVKTEQVQKKAKEEGKEHKIKAIIVYERKSTIMKDFVGMFFRIHNGKSFVDLFVEDRHVGHKFGEFSPTRKNTIHSGEKASQQVMKSAKAKGPKK